MAQAAQVLRNRRAARLVLQYLMPLNPDLTIQRSPIPERSKDPTIWTIARRITADFCEVGIPIVANVNSGTRIEVLHYDYLDDLNVYERVFVMAHVEKVAKEYSAEVRAFPDAWNEVEVGGLSVPSDDSLPVMRIDEIVETYGFDEEEMIAWWDYRVNVLGRTAPTFSSCFLTVRPVLRQWVEGSLVAQHEDCGPDRCKVVLQRSGYETTCPLRRR